MKLAMFLFCAAAALTAQEEGEYRFGTTVVISTGLEGKIYHIGEYSKKLPRNLEKKKPAGTIYTTTLNIPPQDFRVGFPGVTKRIEWFAIDYHGKFWLQAGGMYKFILTSDDGSILYIDDQVAIDNDGVHSAITKEVTMQLAEGVHKIRVSYFQGPKFEVALILKIAQPGKPAAIFNTDNFKPPSTVETLPASIPHN